MAPIDLSKNRNEILKVHKEVSDPKSPTNWALFGYDGKTDVLTVSSKGDGGIAEFTEELNSGRILYGYLKVIDPNSNLPKFVFINWQGEGVPEMIKGGRASHVREVSSLLKGAHVSINARNEDDIDEETIMSKVSKASGANYSFHKEPKRDTQPAGPVGSVYEKIKPQIEIKPVLREKFWENAAKDESTRKDAEKKRLAAEREKHDKELKERELQDAKKREERENDRFKKAQEIKAANQKANAPAQGDKSAWENEQESAKKDEEERAKRSEQTRKERANEAQKLIASATSQARSVFQQQPTSQFDNKPKEAPPARKLKTDFLETDNSETKPQVKPPSQSQPRAQAPAPSLPKAQVPPPSMPVMEIYEDQSCINKTVETNDDIYDDTTVNENDDIYDDAAGAPPARTPPSSAVSQSLVKGLPKRVESDEEEEQTYDDIAVEEDKQDIYDDTSASADAAGICAIAIYDYQAAEDNEISFDPDDKIVDIEMVDDGWWVGTTSDGKRGMFPANYVEVINS